MNIIDPKTLTFLFDDIKIYGKFTIKSLRTNKDFTFKYKTEKVLGNYRLEVYVEKEYLKFNHIGYFDGEKVYHKYFNPNLASNAISWVLRNIKNNNWKALEEVEIYHLGKCLKCGRTLTDAISIERGLGSKCVKN
jgi:hypothetical protein